MREQEDGAEHYDDGSVVIDERGVTLRHYYFPTGRPRTIAFTDIVSVDVQPLTWLNGRARLWGTVRPTTWLPLDLGRVRRTDLLVLDVGHRVRPAFTPRDVDAVTAAITAGRGR
jgi:hypothetical protein